MRPVAILLAGLFLALTIPSTTLASDDCAASQVHAAPGCIDSNTATAGQAPVRFYLYYAWVQCPLNPGCLGSPPASVVGILWQETNNVNGLQRHAGNPPGTPADEPLLL